MGKYAAFRVFLLSFIVLSIISSASATRSVASTDRVPLGDWTHDAMISLAADGLVPGMSARLFEGDRRFNRLEMAGVIASILQSAESTHPNSRQRALINHLVSEFRPELTEVAPETVGQWSSGQTKFEAIPLGYLTGLAVKDLRDESAPDTSYRASAFLNFSGSTFGIYTLAEHEERFYHDPRVTTKFDKSFIGGAVGDVSWLIGRAYANWGPSYAGSLIMSENAPAFWQIRGSKDVDFGTLIGSVKITEFASTFEDVHQRLYLFGRRYEKRLSDRWHLGISETAKMNETPNPLILVMPFYLYQHLFLTEDEEINNLAGADLTYRTPSGMELYGELVIDDITSPRIFGKSNTRPRKAGFTFGASIPQPFGGRRHSLFVAEYTLIDRLTYGATRAEVPELAYIHDFNIIGSPIGPNSQALYLRGEYTISEKFDLIGEYLNQRQNDPGPPERGSRRLLSLTAAYDIAPDKSLAVRIAPFKITAPGSSVEDGTEFELRASFSF